MTELQENLTKARDSARLAHADLRAALTPAKPLESLALLPLIERAATLAADLDRLLWAVIDHDIIDTALTQAKEPTA